MTLNGPFNYAQLINYGCCLRGERYANKPANVPGGKTCVVCYVNEAQHVRPMPFALRLKEVHKVNKMLSSEYSAVRPH